MNTINLNNLTKSSALINDLKEIESGRFKRQRILGRWKKIISESPKDEKKFESELFTVLINLLNETDTKCNTQSKFLLNYLEMINSTEKFQPNKSIIVEFHEDIIKAINHFLNQENTDTNQEVLEDLFDLYFHYPLRSYAHGYSSLYDEITKEAALLVPSFIKKYPEDIGNLVMSIFKRYHPSALDEYTNLIIFYLKNADTIDDISILDEMFSLYNEKSDFFCKNSPIIIENLLKNYNFLDEDISFLCSQILYYLDIDENYKKALKYCSKSKTTKKSIELIINAFKNSKEIQTLKSFYNDINLKDNTAKKYQINKQANVEFSDFNFKLLVIEELMYNQEILKPKLILNDFIAEYTKREISRESDGYNIIPEIKKYFKNLDIDDSLLAKVETLDVDFEYGGMCEILENMWPFWDPGCQDEILFISNKAIEDIKFLPNLKQIQGINFTKINKKNQNILKEKNIELVESEE